MKFRVRLFVAGVTYWLADGMNILAWAIDLRPVDTSSDMTITLSSNGHRAAEITRTKENP